MKRRMTPRYVAALGLATTVGFFLLITGLLLEGKNAVWGGDELYQCVNTLLYAARTTRASFRSMLHGGGFVFPSYSLNLGYGIDIFGLLSMCAGDIFYWPVLLCPGKYVEYCYVGLILLRMLFCSWFFSLYCLRHGKSYDQSFVGSLLYTFGGQLAFGSALRNPFFLTTAAFFPLILVGVDEVFEFDKSRLFVIALSLQLLASVHFTYMTCIMMLVYCLIKYFFGYRDRSFRDFITLVSRFIVHILLSFLIAGVMVFPTVAKLLSQERLSLQRINNLWYANKGFLAFLSDSMTVPTWSVHVLLGPVHVFLLVVFFTCRQFFDKRFWLAATLSGILALLGVWFLPIGRVLNGFAYSTERWMYAYDFCFAYIACCATPVLKRLDHAQWVSVISASVLVAIIGLLLVRYASGLSLPILSGYLVFGIVLVFVMLLAHVCEERAMSIAFSSLMLFGILTTSVLYCSSNGKNYASTFMEIGTTYSTLMSKNYASVADDIEDDSLFRFSGARTYGIRNASMNHKHFAIDYYKALYNQGVDSLRTELGLSDDHFNTRYYGSDGRLAIEGLTGSKYFIANKDDATRVPYGYEYYSDGKIGQMVWKSNYSLPLAFSISQAISRSEYSGLSMAEKQEALLQGCVLDDTEAEKFSPATVKLSSQVIPIEIESDEGIVLEDGAIVVTKGGSAITFRFDGLPDAETYIQFINLRYDLVLPSELAALRGDKTEGVDYFRKDLLAWFPIELTIDMKTDVLDKSFAFSTGTNKQYGGKHDWIINAGYSHEPQTSITLAFERAGKYTYDEFSVVCQPVAPVAEYLDDLMPYGAQDITFDGKHLSLDFTTDTDTSLAVITVPYDSGWKALVDGEPADIMRADTAFMAIELSGKGHHNVLLTYTLPIVRIGLLISILGLVLFVCADVMLRRNDMAHSQKETPRRPKHLMQGKPTRGHINQNTERTSPAMSAHLN